MKIFHIGTLLSLTLSVAWPQETLSQNSYEPRKMAATTSQFKESNKMEIGIDSSLVLKTANPGHFRSPIFKVHLTHPEVVLERKNGELSFVEMTKLRNDSKTNLAGSISETVESLQQDGGIELSNVGVSMTVQVTIEGAEYAVLSYRGSENRFMLVSGYVDSSIVTRNSPSLFWVTVAKEASEELLPIKNSRLPFRIILESKNGFSCPLQTAYEPLTYAEDSATLIQTDLPVYIPNAIRKPIRCEGTTIDAGFVYSRLWNSGQIIFSFKMEIPAKSGFSHLFHAEDRLEKVGDELELVTFVSRRNLVLAKLQRNGKLTGEFFRFEDGVIREVEVEPSNTFLSEAFCLSQDSKFSGVVESDRVSLADYLEGRNDQ